MKILIIEDELHALERLKNMIGEIAPNAIILGACDSIMQTAAWLRINEMPDLILSDVQLTDGLSFEIFAQLEKKIPVVFISAYDQYAIQAFQAEGLHYLLKPVKKEELANALHRYTANVNTKDVLVNNATVSDEELQKFQERFIIHMGNQMVLIEAEDIAYAYAENKLTYIVTSSEKKYIIDLTVEKLEQALNPVLFYRINRQCIVQLKTIIKMQPATKQRIALTLLPAPKFETITSFERTPNFKRWLLGDV